MYASKADLITKFGSLQLAKLTNEDRNSDVPDDDALNLALEEATAEIDLYLGKCYQVPLATVPSGIKFKAIAIARYHLEQGCECSEKIQKQYDDAIAWLKDVCCGDCPQEIPGLTKNYGDRSDSVVYRSAPRVFTRNNLQTYTEVSSRYANGDRYKY